MKTTASLLALLVCLITPRSLLAHAFLDHSDPKVGSEVSAAPTEVRIWFTQEIEPAFSSIQVFDAGGKEVDKKDCHQDSKDKTLLIVSIPADAGPGAYKVSWHVISIDTHKTQGDFKFTINAK